MIFQFEPLLVALFCVAATSLSAASTIDNQVIGTPVIQCRKNSIYFAVETRNPFKGKVYVKGEYERKECKALFGSEVNGPSPNVRTGSQRRPNDNTQFNRLKPGNGPSNNHGSWYSTIDKMGYPESGSQHFQGNGPRLSELLGNNHGVNPPFIARSKECPLQCPPCSAGDEESRRLRRKTNQAEIELELGTCNLHRDRTLSPPGVQVSVVVVVSFHQNFITKVDKAYHIQCAYGEAEKMVTAEVEVNTQPATNIEGIVQPPKCRYEIVDESGRLIKNVRVGQHINHRWVCDTPVKDYYGMLVHDCYAEDGQGRREIVINSEGCSRDAFVIPTPSYDAAALTASVRTEVVKFPDRNSLEFQCSISLCTRPDERCNGITPPNCHSSRTKRSSEWRVNTTEPWQLHTQALTVVDIDSQVDFSEITKRRQAEALKSPELHELCLTVVGFGALVASSTFLSTVAGTIGVLYLFTRQSSISSKRLEAW
uniref:ZP domain-containing protein n=1 Tax=Steinernema glaseri TaxID=37863 RepID=A0A1I7XZ65_9BILA